jgi:hypothetical protein
LPRTSHSRRHSAKPLSKAVVMAAIILRSRAQRAASAVARWATAFRWPTRRAGAYRTVHAPGWHARPRGDRS